MADDKNNRKNTNKRSREECSDETGAITTFKKINVEPNDSSSRSEDSNSPTEEAAGVFDFPWMKEGAMMKSDLKFEDAFASSLDATNVSGIFESDDRLILSEKCGWQGAEADGRSCDMKKCMKEEEDVNDGDDGLECVWDSLLSQQPLSNIEFEAGGFCKI